MTTALIIMATGILLLAIALILLVGMIGSYRQNEVSLRMRLKGKDIELTKKQAAALTAESKANELDKLYKAECENNLELGKKIARLQEELAQKQKLMEAAWGEAKCCQGRRGGALCPQTEVWAEELV